MHRSGPDSQASERRRSKRRIVVILAATLITSTSGPIARAGAATLLDVTPRRAKAAAAKPYVNPANPSCGSSPSTFSGGTGAFYSNQFESNYVTAPFTGAADVPNGKFMNIFLFNGGGSWDAHMSSLPASMRGPTQEQIDALTNALICSSYFDDLSQYNINPPTFLGDGVTDPTCVSNVLAAAASTSNIITYGDMKRFAGCEGNANSGVNPPQINIFVAPDIMASAYGQDGLAMCTAATATAAYHGWEFAAPNFTVVPLSSAPNRLCNQPGKMLDSLSHEMVELVSDPGGFGWSHASGLAHADLGKQLDEGELGDICSSVGAFPTPPGSSAGAIPFPDTAGMTDLTVAPYWSDQDERV